MATEVRDAFKARVKALGSVVGRDVVERFFNEIPLDCTTEAVRAQWVSTDDEGVSLLETELHFLPRRGAPETFDTRLRRTIKDGAFALRDESSMGGPIVVLKLEGTRLDDLVKAAEALSEWITRVPDDAPFCRALTNAMSAVAPTGRYR